jgi:PleD family two-component response regulator
MKPSGESKSDIRILLVDDLTSMRKVVRKLLSSLGYSNIREARDASEAVRMLSLGEFDLIISDWNMPTMSGYQLLEFVRSRARHEHVPFVMLTMQSDKESVLAAKESGVSDYLVKPFTVGELENKLQRLLHNPQRAPNS